MLVYHRTTGLSGASWPYMEGLIIDIHWWSSHTLTFLSFNKNIEPFGLGLIMSLTLSVHSFIIYRFCLFTIFLTWWYNIQEKLMKNPRTSLYCAEPLSFGLNLIKSYYLCYLQHIHSGWSSSDHIQRLPFDVWESTLLDESHPHWMKQGYPTPIRWKRISLSSPPYWVKHGYQLECIDVGIKAGPPEICTTPWHTDFLFSREEYLWLLDM